MKVDSDIIEKIDSNDGELHYDLYSRNFTYFVECVGKAYWTYQAADGHLKPDWKFHFSIVKKDYETAWHILTNLMITKKCYSGMKIEICGDNWSEYQRGREITIYWIQLDEEDRNNPDLKCLPEQTSEYWYDFITEAEKQLSEANVIAGPVANGDIPIGKYSSLRNEAYVT